MPPPPSLATLFDPEPNRWGLRGDPYLWAAMREHFAGMTLPDTAEDLEAQITRAFAALTGYEIGHWDHFYVERFAHGGMSSGYVSPEFWREKALPLLRERFTDVTRG